MGTLDAIESSHRREIKAAAKLNHATRPGRAFAILFIVAPFAAVNFMFIPFAGQVLVLAAVILSLCYCYTRRSLKLLIAGFLGAASSLVISVWIASKFGGQAGLAAYSLMALGAAVVIAYNITLIGAFWSLYEGAAQSLDENASKNGYQPPPSAV